MLDSKLVAVLNQAVRYGEQVRLLEEHELVEERDRIRKAWWAFWRQFIGDPCLIYVRRAYHNAYYTY